MSQYNDKPAPGADTPSRNYIPFKKLQDLRIALEKLNYIDKLNSGIIKAALETHKVPFTELEDGGILIEKGQITDSAVLECLAEIFKQNRDRIIDLYNQLGVVTTSKKFEGDETPQIYEGIIQTLNNRQN